LAEFLQTVRNQDVKNQLGRVGLVGFLGALYSFQDELPNFLLWGAFNLRYVLFVLNLQKLLPPHIWLLKLLWLRTLVWSKSSSEN
jgi:hypothetical protein